jgi:ppGpp synthetase/RelA/SpoT-type nucleotidyltranferase
VEAATNPDAPGRRACARTNLGRPQGCVEGPDRSFSAKRSEDTKTEIILVTISEDAIKNAVLRYHREYDRYLKLSARVAEICRFEIVEANAIRAQVTFRAKSPKSLEGKLRRFAASGKKNLPNVQSVFDEVRDLAAVRIATYEQRHEDQVVQLVCKRFVDPGGADPSGERKDKNPGDNNNFYRATHIEAFLPESDVIGTYANVSDVPCEIRYTLRATSQPQKT